MLKHAMFGRFRQFAASYTDLHTHAHESALELSKRYQSLLNSGMKRKKRV